jgi:hypothetical protein
LLRRVEPPQPALLPLANSSVDAIHALIEIRQVFQQGTLYGPRAIQEIAVHVLAGTMQDLRDAGAQVIGPEGPHIELSIPCGGDERGMVSHVLDSLAEIQAALSRIPEPRLEIRAAVVAKSTSAALSVEQMPALDLLGLLNIGPGSYVRVDAKVARWAGRRQMVRLGEVHEVGEDNSTTLYATSLATS